MAPDGAAAGRAAQAKACIVTLDDLLRAPRGEVFETMVTMEPMMNRASTIRNLSISPILAACKV